MLFDTALRKQKGLYRQRQVRDTSLLQFSSNDYLGLSQDARVRAAFQEAFATEPVGSGGSMVISGYHSTHQALEETFCEALNVEAAVLVSSGYVANLSLMLLLAQASLTVLLDKAAHASFYDGLKLSEGVYQRFPHQQYERLAVLRDQYPAEAVILTESVFSMSGFFSPLDTIASFKLPLLVDEAHAFGLYGKEGLGSVVHFGLTEDQVPLRVIPLGKAFGTQGAIVAGKAEWIDAYIQSARGYIYSTGISPALAKGYVTILKLLREAEDLRGRLFENIAYFRGLTQQSALSWTDSLTPIQQLKLGSSEEALRLSDALLKAGIACQAIRPPTVSLSETGLRVVLNAQHTREELYFLIENLTSSL